MLHTGEPRPRRGHGKRSSNASSSACGTVGRCPGWRFARKQNSTRSKLRYGTKENGTDLGRNSSRHFAPRTLACCKPAIRRSAKPGDIVIGTGSARCGLAGHLIYAMRVGTVLPFCVYWERYPAKRPSPETSVKKPGDNIWHRDAFGNWRGIPGALHDERHRDRDLRGRNALISSEFYYFGRDAIPSRTSSVVVSQPRGGTRTRTMRTWSAVSGNGSNATHQNAVGWVCPSILARLFSAFASATERPNEAMQRIRTAGFWLLVGCVRLQCVVVARTLLPVPGVRTADRMALDRCT